MVPNLTGLLAESPAANETCETLAGIFTRSLVANRGWVDSDEVDAFLAAGNRLKNGMLEVVNAGQSLYL